MDVEQEAKKAEEKERDERIARKNYEENQQKIAALKDLSMDEIKTMSEKEGVKLRQDTIDKKTPSSPYCWPYKINQLLDSYISLKKDHLDSKEFAQEKVGLCRTTG